MTRCLVVLVVLGLTEVAAAQESCFVVAGEGERAQHVIGLASAVRVSESCEYAVTPDGPWVAPGSLAGRDTDFLELFQAASQGARATGDPRVVLGRPRVARGQGRQHSLMLRYCAHYLLEEQLAFRVVPQTGGGTVRVDRAGDGCGGGQVELRAVRGVRPERLYAGAAEHTLGTSQRTLELPEGDWSIFAARPGGAVGLRIAVFRTQRVVTPLANHLRAVGLEPSGEPSVPPLFAARWDPSSPGMLLHPTGVTLAQDMLWPELRTASDAGLVWLTYNGVRGAEERQVIANLQLESGDPAAVRLPDAPVREHMRRRYGGGGRGARAHGARLERDLPRARGVPHAELPRRAAAERGRDRAGERRVRVARRARRARPGRGGHAGALLPLARGAGHGRAARATRRAPRARSASRCPRRGAAPRRPTAWRCAATASRSRARGSA
ncbi:MAG: hypothetical protein M5U28_12205 [Sandaracinaceae bacterium]|nr:hypothetical protein [Sandaracinaceae bacterium]